ncbi:MAG: NmrA family NAD(P)-binding protein [Nitrospiraceae bacterium]
MTAGIRTYAIMGATGHVGKVVAERLLRAGHQVHVMGRSVDRLKGLVGQGAISHAGAFDDVDVLTRAFRGVNGVFAMIPPDYTTGNFLAYQDRVGSAIARAVQTAGVPSLVNLSSIGAHLSEKTGPIRGLHKQEARLNDIKELRVVHLRPGYFMENLLWAIPTIHSLGINGSPLKGDLQIPMVATRDIGAKAAEFLADLQLRGHAAFEFVGPKPVTMQEATSVLGKAIGKPDLRYVKFAYEEAEKAMLATGMKPDIVGLFIEMDRGVNEGLIRTTQAMTPDHVGKTRIEYFAQEFAAAFRAATRR